MNTHIYPYSLIVLVVLPLVANSADLVVEENAPPGKYGSIVEAVASAQDGDRIIIQNRHSGNMPWNFQNTNQLTIDKSLTLLSAANDTFFRVQGDIIVEHAPGRDATIIGMRNLQGNIEARGNGSGGFAQVNILDSYLEDGFFNFDFDYFRLHAVGNRVGGIDMDYGQVIGNDVNAGFVFVGEPNSLSTVDTVLMMGNQIIE